MIGCCVIDAETCATDPNEDTKMRCQLCTESGGDCTSTLCCKRESFGEICATDPNDSANKKCQLCSQAGEDCTDSVCCSYDGETCQDKPDGTAGKICIA